MVTNTIIGSGTNMESNTCGGCDWLKIIIKA